ncbi:bifunctional adenosylcobinamide kinase/adenosylcobinamide-phosphate guanylyltransferase [Bartonella tamiae]|uniref:Bifunctional adenosylcobalamin biosynthesis protein n=1 Tax=Bartonella tamiae Th239 TaxID=1094558 RepID=J0ZKR4_9HYPH|nr:bifunctional adenosylcobinamide kinase/adenosylcobinamide-phosphate guanylyltransferase [Bartonella tamiae]EJF88933.1 hypothetical protein ME5_01484 [Bartonella tamiae Th239]EJF94817.1 hypothetical protein MEG_00398 [Bartonella tamiae Th307]
MANITLILGGVRSGKSAFAEQFVLQKKKQAVYIATAEVFDEKMQERVDLHKERRGKQWQETTAPLNILTKLQQFNQLKNIILVDCLTVWLGNLFHYQKNIESHVSSLVEGLKDIQTEIVFVASEVGLGVMPDNQLAREFCDHAGKLNQAISEAASQVYFVAASLPLKLKG